MSIRKIDIHIEENSSSYEIGISHDDHGQTARWLSELNGNAAERATIVSNPTVFGLYGDALTQILKSSDLEVSVWLMPDGEEHKTLDNAALALDAFTKSGLSRTDLVIALGGGVVGDLAGFAASIYLRGVDLIQMPTTLLSMIDSSVGGKTGVNSTGGKNRIGTFYQPAGVIIDTYTLRTLPQREVTAGLCEAVKHGALSGQPLFHQVSRFLERYPAGDLQECFADSGNHDELDALIEAQVSFKAKIVSLDQRESAARTDASSRKTLNFGHTLGHALEKVTRYSHFRHGEAVGYGMLYAAELSKKLDFIDCDQVELLYDVVHRTGPLPSLAGIDPKEVLDEFRFDKKMVAGSLQMILLEGIGNPRIVDANLIPADTLRSALDELLTKTSI